MPITIRCTSAYMHVYFSYYSVRATAGEAGFVYQLQRNQILIMNKLDHIIQTCAPPQSNIPKEACARHATQTEMENLVTEEIHEALTSSLLKVSTYKMYYLHRQ